MKAAVYPKYGSPDVLEFMEVEKPEPKEGQVLIKVQAAAANPLDWHMLRGEPFPARLGNGLLKPKDQRLGADLAGQVEAVGQNVDQFQPGDAVFGVSTGSFAEYVCAPADKVVRKPANISFEAAAAVPVAALTAWQGLGHNSQIQPGQKVLVNGASGGVGTFAVQMAKALGAEVTAVCSTRNLEMVGSIGADHAIDYTQADFTRTGQPYDMILDAVGNRSVFDYKRALGPRGNCVIVGFSSLSLLLQHMLLGPLVSRKGGKRIGMMGMAQVNRNDLVAITELLEAGKVVPVIDRCYPFGETAAALRYLEKGHARGKVVITLP